MNKIVIKSNDFALKEQQNLNNFKFRQTAKVFFNKRPNTFWLKENGIYAFNYGHILHTNPPLVVNEQELKDAFNIVDKALDIADKYTN